MNITDYSSVHSKTSNFCHVTHHIKRVSKNFEVRGEVQSPRLSVLPPRFAGGAKGVPRLDSEHGAKCRKTFSHLLSKWHFKPKSKIARSLAFGEETWKRKERDVITTTTGQEYRDLQIKTEFDNLVQMWKKATSHYSFLGQIITHTAYLRIIGMGEKALPLILEELRQKPNGNWFSALEAITGKDVGQEASSIDEAIQLWLEWGEQNKY